VSTEFVMTDQELVAALTESCTRQLAQYRRLLETAQAILGRLAVTRGDLSAVAAQFKEKQDLLAGLEARRNDSVALVALWQSRKDAARSACNTAALDAALAETETVIKRFLDNEEQIKRYLDRARNGASGGADGQ
jgi:hypothetical protein